MDQGEADADYEDGEDIEEGEVTEGYPFPNSDLSTTIFHQFYGFISCFTAYLENLWIH